MREIRDDLNEDRAKSPEAMRAASGERKEAAEDRRRAAEERRQAEEEREERRKKDEAEAIAKDVRKRAREEVRRARREARANNTEGPRIKTEEQEGEILAPQLEVPAQARSGPAIEREIAEQPRAEVPLPPRRIVARVEDFTPFVTIFGRNRRKWSTLSTSPYIPTSWRMRSTTWLRNCSLPTILCHIFSWHPRSPDPLCQPRMPS